MHKLKRNQKIELPQRLIFVDTETIVKKISDTYKENVFHFGFAEYYRLDKELDVLECERMSFRDKTIFWKWVFEKNKCNTVIYLFAHNFEFDFRILNGFEYLFENGYEIRKWVIDCKLFTLVASKYRKKIDRRTKEVKKEVDRTLRFVSTTNYFHVSLEELGKSIGIEKMERKHENCICGDCVKYCMRDVFIIRYAILKYLKFIKNNNLGNFKSTIASQSLTAFAHRFMTRDIFIHELDYVNELERKSYRGGRTEAFYIGKVNNSKIFCLDINSMYPFVMRNFQYPYKFKYFYEVSSRNALKRLLEKYCVIAHVKIRTNENVFGIKRERLIFPIGSFNAYLCSNELEYAIAKGMIEQIYELAVYEKDYIFRDYVDFFYERRQEYKRDNNRAFNFMCKLFLNSLYGKFGENKKENKKLGESDDFFGHYKLIDQYDGYIGLVKIVNGEEYLQINTDLPTANTFVAIASEVTANARMLLWSLMKTAGLENIYYVDTDSIFTNEIGYERLKPYISENELGKLKLEKVCNYLEIRSEKDYTLDDEQKIKGIKKSAKQISENQFEQEQFEQFATALRNNTLNTYRIKTVKKELKRLRLKNVLGTDNRCYPIVLLE